MLTLQHCVAALALGALSFVAVPELASPSTPTSPAAATRVTRYDVAMDGHTFSFQGRTNERGFPAKGTPFIIEGYIYPEGTFQRYGPLSGVNPDGSPQFPRLVLGRWICRGWHLLDGDAVTGAVVATTQIFDFNTNCPGSETFTTEGIELADFNVEFLRNVTGGTGEYRSLAGQMQQVYVGNGLNVTGGFNTSFEIRIRGREAL
jgi:hypothetical protein